jgi:hypothetical protein
MFCASLECSCQGCTHIFNTSRLIFSHLIEGEVIVAAGRCQLPIDKLVFRGTQRFQQLGG